MRVRYENWVNGLSGDWLISRQRFFGVPIPVWYPLDGDGNPVFDSPIVPDEAALPVDPSSDPAPGYSEDQRGVAGGFQGELDVMDTWATSSLTPQLAGGWERDDELWQLVAPYDLRPQGQDIIRTWLFSTLLRSQLEDGRAPWRTATVSGFIVDPDRKKMSKSKGNVVTPAAMLEQHGSDAVRYWAASSRLGTDAAFDPQNPTQIKIGRRLAIKILNAAKFIHGFPLAESAGVADPLDLSMLATLDTVIAEATSALENYDHARALETIEAFFWTFCDDYLELVKERAYGEDGVSAAAALHRALDALQRLFAPFLPFATEETWSWSHDDSVHLRPWPTVAGLGGDPAVLAAASTVLTAVRRAKTDAKASQKTPARSAVVTAPAPLVASLRLAAGDLAAVGRIAQLEFAEGDELTVSVELETEA
ncbi:Valine--tRNA ligase [Rathayibacter tanaceti]|nr:Valine--tRNA ligase [Rathayibacter tanaceti]